MGETKGLLESTVRDRYIEGITDTRITQVENKHQRNPTFKIGFSLGVSVAIRLIRLRLNPL